MDFSRFDHWIHRSFPVSPEGLAFYRIFYASFALIVIAPGHDVYSSLTPFASIPASMFVPPPGPMMLFSGFPGIGAVSLLHVAVNVSLVAVLVGYRTRFFSTATGVLFFLIYGFSYSLGKINHNFLFIVLPVVMAFSNWGAAYSYDARFGASRRRDVHAWTLTMLALLVGFAMFTAGFAKILGGWLNPETQAVYGHLVKHYLIRGRTDLLAPFLINLKSAVLWETLDYATVLFEVGFLIAVTRGYGTRAFAGLAVLFHLGAMLMLNIAYAFNLIVYAGFVDWDRIYRTVQQRLIRQKRWRGRLCRSTRWTRLPFKNAGSGSTNLRSLYPGRVFIHFSVFSGGLIFYSAGSPLLWFDESILLDSDLTFREVLAVSTAAVLVLVTAVRIILARLRGDVGPKTLVSESAYEEHSAIGARAAGDAGDLRPARRDASR